MATTIAGLVWWLVHAQHVAKRTAPLTVFGPPGIEARFETAAEALFPGSTRLQRRFDLRFPEMLPGTPLEIGPARVTAFEVSHPSGAPSYALRFEMGGKVLASPGTANGPTPWCRLDARPIFTSWNATPSRASRAFT